jgi:glycosyltransferase involved in cell wall biosynthesis
MKKALTLSIVIPVYNDERYLQACLDSIAAQTVLPEEVIVVDNNCTDGSMAIARRYPFVRIVRETRQGIVFARNKGFDSAVSIIIGRIDTDSVLPPNWVQQVHSFYAGGSHAGHAITGGGTMYNIRAPRFTSWVLDQIVYRINRFIMGHYILWGSNMAITKRQWQLVRGRVCLRNDIHEDLDIAMHLHDEGLKITYVASLKVGVAARRLFADYKALWPRMLMWPNTLRAHHKSRWILGWIGAVLIIIFSPVPIIAERLMQLIGRPALPQ